MPPTPRYLAAFGPKAVPHYFCDVLIIGGGLAGLRAAMAVDPRLSVLVTTKDEIQQSSSRYAQGGIAGVIDPDDTFAEHIADTLTAGGELCDREVVDAVVREAPDRINELISWGAQFDEVAGELELGREGGHSQHRIVHALGDATGKEIMRAVIAKARGVENLEIWENSFTIDLLTGVGRKRGQTLADHEVPQAKEVSWEEGQTPSPTNACRGALVWNPVHGKTYVWAKQTILCTGGAGQMFRETTNPAVATGDGHAIAYRAGAEVRDLEFMQFHPTVLYIAGSSRSLITEATRGEGAHLVDSTGHRFMPEYDERAELAPRDVVSQSIITQMSKTRHPCVYLDMSHVDAELVRRRFPGIAKMCGKFGLDITTDLIPVRPGAHYMIGGVAVNEQGQTTVPGLWAAGEATSSGLHGANRLASNSLLEGMVYGRLAGEGAAALALAMEDEFHVVPIANAEVEENDEPLDLADIRNSLTSLMGRAAGVNREAAVLQSAAKTIDGWCRYVLARQFDRPPGWELQNMLILGRLMTEAALAREESRGVHFRSDFPETDPSWRRHLTFVRT